MRDFELARYTLIRLLDQLASEKCLVIIVPTLGNLPNRGQQGPIRCWLILNKQILVTPAHRVFFFDSAYVQWLRGVDMGTAFLICDRQNHSLSAPHRAFAVTCVVSVPPWLERHIARHRIRWRGLPYAVPLDADSRGHFNHRQAAMRLEHVSLEERQRCVKKQHLGYFAKLSKKPVRAIRLMGEDPNSCRKWVATTLCPVERFAENTEQLELVLQLSDERRPVTRRRARLLLLCDALPTGRSGEGSNETRNETG